MRGAFAGGSGRVWSEDDIVDAHEFGHAYANAIEGKRVRKLASLIHGQRNSRIYSGLIQVIPPGPGSPGLGNETQFVFENGSSKNVDCISVSAIFSDLQHQPPRQMESSSQ